MRFPSSFICLLSAILLSIGCSGQPEIRNEATDVRGKVNLNGIPAKDLVITFQPQQNTHPGGAKLQADGSFTAKLAPGKYVYYFNDEANASIPAYKKLPKNYKETSAEHVVTVDPGKEILIDVK